MAAILFGTGEVFVVIVITAVVVFLVCRKKDRKQKD